MGKINLIQKIIGCVAALLLVVGIVPIGLFYFAEPVVAEGSVVRISPEAETFVYSDAKNKNRDRLDKDNLVVGNYWNTYLKFDLSVLGNVNKADITRAKLRLAVLWNGKNSSELSDCSFNVSYIDNNNWNDNMTWASKPMGEETYLCTASGGEANTILEIDLSEFVRNAVAYEDEVITLKLSPSLSNNAYICFASTENPDPTYRPYLKILVGDAYDTDSPSLNKTYLEQSGYVSAALPNMPARELLEKNNGILVADSGSVTYLKFRLDLNNIKGAVRDARIFLRPLRESVNTRLDVYLLDNDAWWDGELCYNNMPEGESYLVKSYDGIEARGGFSVDVTDIIYDMVKNQRTTVTFVLDGTQNDPASTDSLELYSAGSEFAPSLAVSVTDNPYETALREALVNLNGSNSSLDNITGDLPNRYTASNGETVTIRWELNDNFSLETLLGLRKSVVTNSGKVNHPSVFEEPKTVQVKAILTSGDRSLERYVVITVMPEFGVPNRLLPLRDALE